MSWITTILFGIRHVLQGGDPLPDRPTLNFVGATIVDNPAENRLDVTIDNSAMLAAATPLATPKTLALRGSSGEAAFGGTCNFSRIAASSNVDVYGNLFAHVDLSVSNNAAIGGGLNVGSDIIGAGDVQCAGDVAGASHILAGAVTQMRLMSICPSSKDHGWIPGDDGIWRNDTVGTIIDVPLPLPNGVKVDTINVRIDPAVHGAWPVDIYPTATFKKYNKTTGVASIASVTDVPASQAAYEAAHTLTISVGGVVMDRANNTYHLTLSAEKDTNSVAGCKLLYIEVSWTRSVGTPIGLD